jgi:hypothetical protein
MANQKVATPIFPTTPCIAQQTSSTAVEIPDLTAPVREAQPLTDTIITKGSVVKIQSCLSKPAKVK